MRAALLGIVAAGSAVAVAAFAQDGGRGGSMPPVLGARVESGLLGDFEFDRYGDTTLNAIGVYRIEEGRLRLKTVISKLAERVARE